MILSTQPQFPHLVAMETHLTCVIPCIEQEDFVSMVRYLTVIAIEISVYSIHEMLAKYLLEFF